VEPLLEVGFKINLRRYTEGLIRAPAPAAAAPLNLAANTPATAAALGAANAAAHAAAMWRPQTMARDTRRQGLTLVPISAQLELFCPPHNPQLNS